MKLHDSITGALLLFFAALVYWHTRAFPEIPGDPIGPALFPRLIASGLGLCGVALLVSGLVKRVSQSWVEIPEWTRSPRMIAGFLLVVLGLLAGYFLLDKLGFLVIAPVLLAALMLVLRVRPWTTVPIAIGVSLLIHTIFYKGLGVPLPWGLLAAWAW